jgi:UDP-2,3-diacylglucosamine pyrophosphatase LpxH
MSDFTPPPDMEGGEFYAENMGQNLPEGEGDPRTSDENDASPPPQPDDEAIREFLLRQSASDAIDSGLVSAVTEEDLNPAHELGFEHQSPFAGEGTHSDAPEADADNSGEEFVIDAENRAKILELTNAAIDDFNRGVGETGHIKGLKVNHWQMGMKNAEQEFEAHDLHAASFVVDTSSLDINPEPEWPLVQRPIPKLAPIKPRTSKPIAQQRKLKQAYILPDTQIPYHDPAATAIALQATYDAQPEQIILLGDYLDLAEQSKYAQEPEFARTTQIAVDVGHRILELLREGCPDSRIILLEGNHDKRLHDHVKTNAMGSYNIRRGNEPRSWPVMSLPYLLFMEELQIEYVSGYPNNKHWINPLVKCVHGDKVRSNGSTAQAVNKADLASVIFGHVHRQETHDISVEYYDPNTRREKKVDKFAHTPGCLCRVDGTVPDGRNGRDYQSGEIVPKVNNWQQGFSSLLYDDKGEVPPILQPYKIRTYNDGKKLKYMSVVGNDSYAPDAGLVRQISPENFESAYTGTFERSPSVRRIATA